MLILVLGAFFSYGVLHSSLAAHGLSVYSKSQLQPETQLFSGHVTMIYAHEPPMLIGMAGMERMAQRTLVSPEAYCCHNKKNRSVTAYPAWMIWFNSCEA